jgi:TRAP-type mannitol/chloroaromatic compound transport system permease large subunit
VAPPQVTTLALYRGVWPYVGLQILVLALVWVWPGMLLG